MKPPSRSTERRTEGEDHRVWGNVIGRGALKRQVQHFWEKMLRGKNLHVVEFGEWTMIHTQLEMGIKPVTIVMGLNRSASTLSRELRRNGGTRPTTRRGPGRPPVTGGYRASAAHTRDQACTVTTRVARRLQPETALGDQVTRYLKAGYSPVQIADTLALVHADTPSLQVSRETI